MDLGLVLVVLSIAFAVWLRRTPQQSVVEFPMERGERQLWIGRPRQGIILQGRDIPLTLLAILWWLICISWQTPLLEDPSLGQFILSVIGLPFVAIGVYLLPGRFFIDARRRKLTTYAVTDQRAIIAVGNTMTSRPMVGLGAATLLHNRDGTGTITFTVHGPSAEFESRSRQRLEQESSPRVLLGLVKDAVVALRGQRFEHIPDAAHVHSLILRTAQEHGSPVMERQQTDVTSPDIPLHAIPSDLAARDESGQLPDSGGGDGFGGGGGFAGGGATRAWDGNGGESSSDSDSGDSGGDSGSSSDGGSDGGGSND